MSNHPTTLEDVPTERLRVGDLVFVSMEPDGDDSMTVGGVVVSKASFRLPGEPYPTHAINGVRLTLDFSGRHVTREVHRHEMFQRASA